MYSPELVVIACELTHVVRAAHRQGKNLCEMGLLVWLIDVMTVQKLVSIIISSSTIARKCWIIFFRIALKGIFLSFDENLSLFHYKNWTCWGGILGYVKWPITRKIFPFDDVIMSNCDHHSSSAEHIQEEIPSGSFRFNTDTTLNSYRTNIKKPYSQISINTSQFLVEI